MIKNRGLRFLFSLLIIAVVIFVAYTAQPQRFRLDGASSSPSDEAAPVFRCPSTNKLSLLGEDSDSNIILGPISLVPDYDPDPYSARGAALIMQLCTDLAFSYNGISALEAGALANCRNVPDFSCAKPCQASVTAPRCNPASLSISPYIVPPWNHNPGDPIDPNFPPEFECYADFKATVKGTAQAICSLSVGGATTTIASGEQ